MERLGEVALGYIVYALGSTSKWGEKGRWQSLLELLELEETRLL